MHHQMFRYKKQQEGRWCQLTKVVNYVETTQPLAFSNVSWITFLKTISNLDKNIVN